MAERKKDFPRGTVIGGRYEVLQKLGEGSFSAVYRVLDRSLSVECAIKVLHMWATLDKKLVERFKREVLYSRRIVHEGCCQVFDFAEYGEVAVLAMELVHGWTLDALLAKLGVLPLDVASSLVAQACGSVAVLHRHDVIHRDIKAENMMVNREGRLKVLDLGMSWSAELSSLTAVGSILGTPAYMAPEFIEGGAPTTQTDVYALGVLAYLLFAGQLPFRAPDLAKLLAQHMGAQPASLRQFRPDLSPEVDALVLSCLAKQAKKRPVSAGTLDEAWKTLLGGPPDPGVVRKSVALLGVPTMDTEFDGGVTQEMSIERPSTPATDSLTNMILTALSPSVTAATTVLPRQVPPVAVNLEKDSVTQIVPVFKLPPPVPPSSAAGDRSMEQVTDEATRTGAFSISGDFRLDRRRLGLLLVVLGLLVVVAGGVVVLVLMRQSPRVRAILEPLLRALRGLFGG